MGAKELPKELYERFKKYLLKSEINEFYESTLRYDMIKFIEKEIDKELSKYNIKGDVEVERYGYSGLRIRKKKLDMGDVARIVTTKYRPPEKEIYFQDEVYKFIDNAVKEGKGDDLLAMLENKKDAGVIIRDIGFPKDDIDKAVEGFAKELRDWDELSKGVENPEEVVRVKTRKKKIGELPWFVGLASVFAMSSYLVLASSQNVTGYAPLPITGINWSLVLVSAILLIYFALSPRRTESAVQS